MGISLCPRGDAGDIVISLVLTGSGHGTPKSFQFTAIQIKVEGSG